MMPVVLVIILSGIIAWREWGHLQERKDSDARMKDIERHFVTRRAADGSTIETLADIPMAERAERRLKMKGMSWPQRRQTLEQTEGGKFAVQKQGG